MKVVQMRLARPGCSVMIVTRLAVMMTGWCLRPLEAPGIQAFVMRLQVFSEIRLTDPDPPHIQHPLTATPPCAADANQCFSSSSGRSHPDQSVGKRPVSVESESSA